MQGLAQHRYCTDYGLHTQAPTKGISGQNRFGRGLWADSEIKCAARRFKLGLPLSVCFGHGAFYWPWCSIMCYCLQTYEQLTLKSEMCATTCPQAPFEQVLLRNLLPRGLCKINQLCAIAYHLMKQLTLQLDMCATNCPQTPSEQVLTRNHLPRGLRKINQVCVLLLTNL